MIDGYPIPPFYASKDENGYSMLDGKQRGNAIADFINNKFALKNIPEIKDEEGNIFDINDLTFSELSEELQDIIKDYSLTIYYFDSITEDDITEIFRRLNNGKPLSSIELTRVKAKSIDKIKEIGKHELFTSALTEKAINKYTNEDIVMKSWALLNCENPSFETKYMRPLTEKADITEEQEEVILKTYTRILEVYKNIVSIEEKQAQKVAKRVITRTHLLSLVPVALKSIDENIDIIEFTKFATEFFSGKKSASIDDIYNNAASSNTGKAENVKRRIDSITDAYNTYFKNETVTKEPEKVKEELKQEPKKEVKHSLPELDLRSSDAEWDNYPTPLPSNILGAYGESIA